MPNGSRQAHTVSGYPRIMRIALVLLFVVFVLAGIVGYLSRVGQKTREAWREGRDGR
jgi:hypothetical protein